MADTTSEPVRTPRIGFLTNLTSEVNVEVLQALANAPQLNLAHVFFYDTFASSRTSILTTIRQHGLKKIFSKGLGLVMRKLPFTRSSGGQTHLNRTCYDFASQAQISSSVVKNMNDADVAAQIRSLELDFVIVCVCKNILKETLLKDANTQFINVHPSVLPNYRGPCPTFWMLFNLETETGATMHLIGKGIDKGPILHQFSMPLDWRQTEPEIEAAVFRQCANEIADVVEAYHRGLIRPQPQFGEGSYHSFPSPAQRTELARSKKERLKANTQTKTPVGSLQ